jgi:hypothetical protein
MHSLPSVTTCLEFEKVRALPLQIAEENQSICAACLMTGRKVFCRGRVFLASSFFILASNLVEPLGVSYALKDATTVRCGHSVDYDPVSQKFLGAIPTSCLLGSVTSVF